MAKSVKKKEKKTSKSVAAKPAKRSRTSSMDTPEIRDFISFIAQSGLNEVKIETPKLKLYVKRNADRETSHASSSPAFHPPMLATDAPPPRQDQKNVVEEEAASKDASTVEIKSPMVGTFYRSANPKAEPFVSVGDRVKKGQTVCIIEAMKLFNEIESETSGTIVKITAENASPVEYGQTLFLVEPA